MTIEMIRDILAWCSVIKTLGSNLQNSITKGEGLTPWTYRTPQFRIIRRRNTMKLRSPHLSASNHHRILSGLFAIIFLLLSGCATVGKDFPVTDVTDIKIGITTQKEIRTMFGSPWRTGIEDGQRTWTYGNYNYGLFSAKKAKDLVIRFDDKNVVVSYTFSTTEHNE